MSNDCRFEEVRKLVKDLSLRVTDIAKQTGYNKGHISRLRKEAMRNITNFECPRCGHCCQAKGENQEPVAVVFDPYDAHGLQWLCQHPPNTGDRLYLAPPKREWVGLTVLEVYECWKTGDVVEAVEAKLKEKNGKS